MNEMPDVPTHRVGLGVCGGISAYKTAELARLIRKARISVLPIMTRAGAEFLGPLTLEALCEQPVRMDATWGHGTQTIEHISLVHAWDALVIAPLTANTAAKMAHGLADNFLTTAYLAFEGPTLVCPAMNRAMLSHSATQANLATLQDRGVKIVLGEPGDLACGDHGPGRMAEPTVIFDHLQTLISRPLPNVKGKHVLVTAGPTIEPLDPVRFFSNRSSGKMGFALARAWRNAGARVTLIHGPVSIPVPCEVTCVPIQTAAQMWQAVTQHHAQMDVIIMAAAVADYSPTYSEQKLKKDRFDGTLKLSRTQDILAWLGRNKAAHQVLVGFAAESDNLEAHARTKLKNKNLDCILANDISSNTAGFQSDQNAILAITATGVQKTFPLQDKALLAQELVHWISCELL